MNASNRKIAVPPMNRTIAHFSAGIGWSGSATLRTIAEKPVIMKLNLTTAHAARSNTEGFRASGLRYHLSNVPKVQFIVEPISSNRALFRATAGTGAALGAQGYPLAMGTPWRFPIHNELDSFGGLATMMPGWGPATWPMALRPHVAVGLLLSGIASHDSAQP